MRKKFLVPVLALLMILVPIHSLSAQTSQSCPAKTTRIELSSGPLRYLCTSIKNCKSLIVLNKCTNVKKNVKIPTIHIYNNKLGTWTKIPAKVITIPVKPDPQPNPAPTPTPAPSPAPVPAPEPDDPTVITPGPAEQSVDFSAMQKEMLGYINAERASANLAPLTLDAKLCQGATLKSKDMAENNYFSHNSPTYGSPFEMMKDQGITYRTAGENIAKNTSVKGAHTAFMNSSGHRANILNKSFNKVGLGFYQKGQYLYVTQWFTN